MAKKYPVLYTILVWIGIAAFGFIMFCGMYIWSFLPEIPASDGEVRLSFPKIQSGGIRAVRQNQRIIRCDVCDHPPACNVYSRSVQATTPA